MLGHVNRIFLAEISLVGSSSAFVSNEDVLRVPARIGVRALKETVFVVLW